jgi:Gp37 protein
MSAVVLDTPWSGVTFAPPTPLDISTIETAIVSHLNAAIDTIEIAHYPDRPETYRMTHRIGAALVRYAGAKYGPLIDSAAVVQERRLSFEITLMMRDLGWSLGGEPDGTSPGAYAMIEAVRAALTGFRIPGCSKAYPVGERFVERDKQGGVWIYAIVFVLATAAVEPSSTENFPLLVKAMALEEGGLTTLSLAPELYTFDSGGQIALPQQNLSQVSVTDPLGGAAYAPDVDYTADTVNGIISLIPGGAITEGASVEVGYSYAETVTALASGGSAPTAPTN